MFLAAVIGVAVGVWVGTRPQPPPGPTGAASRPTIVIAAPPSPAAATTPSSAPSPIGASTAPSPSPAEREYIVQAGDTLRTIAEQEYGDQAQWQRLYEANTDVIGNNPDSLQPGMRLRIPAS